MALNVRILLLFAHSFQGMICLVYFSSATHPFSDEELRQLLLKARENNTQAGITGMLLHRGGNFLQVLEGPGETVEAVYEKIKNDPRHHGMIRYPARPITERQFGDWSMAFRNLDDPELQKTPGFSNFLNEGFDRNRMSTDQGYVMRLLDVFRLNNR